MWSGWRSISNFFTGGQRPQAPTAAQLYSGPAAFSGHQTEQADAARPYLGRLATIGDRGWTGTDQAAFNLQQRQANQGEQAQRGAITNNAAARGQASGGLQFMQALAAQQGGANRAQEAGTQMATAGADRRMAATQAGAQLAGQAGAANDAFNQFATQANANALTQSYQARQQAYDAKQQNKRAWFSGITGAL